MSNAGKGPVGRLVHHVWTQPVEWLRHHLLHEALVALFIASVLGILEHHEWLQSLNAASLQLAATSFRGAHTSGPPAEAAGAVPRVVVLTEPLYETVFRQRSPLDRGILAEMLERLFPLAEGRNCTDPTAPGILRNVPGVLVVDLDLSPDPPPPGGAEGGDGSGDARLGKVLRCLAGQTDLVLARPFRMRMPEAQERKVQWLATLCSQGVWFAQPYIVSINGAVLSLDVHPQTLAQVAYRIQQGRTGRGPPPPRAPCDRMHVEAVSEGLEPVAETEGERILDFHFVRDIRPFPINKLADLDALRFTGRDVVFLGGSFGPGDKYVTPAGMLDGVVLHAAAYYSLHHPVKTSSGLKPMGLDWIIGIVAGLLFTGVHNGYKRRERAVTARRSWAGTEGAGMLAALLLALNLLLPFVAGFALLYWAGQRLLYGEWVHPIGMVLGMFLHSNIVRTHHPHFAHPIPVAGASWDIRPWGSWTLLVAAAGVVGWAVVEALLS